MFLKIIFLVATLAANKKIAECSDTYCSRTKRTKVPTYDIYHSNFPCWLAKYYWLPDIVFLASIGLWFLNYSRDLFEVTVVKVAIFYSIRALLLSSTLGYVSMRYVHDLHHNFGLNQNYSDLLVSGHVGVTCILAGDMLNYGCCWQKIISTWLVGLSAYVNLAVGDHYTSDVVLAIVLAILLHTSKLF